jgi:hypothetical protein
VGFVDTSAKSAAFGRKNLGGLMLKIDSITSHLPVIRELLHGKFFFFDWTKEVTPSSRAIVAIGD